MKEATVRNEGWLLICEGGGTELPKMGSNLCLNLTLPKALLGPTDPGGPHPGSHRPQAIINKICRQLFECDMDTKLYNVLS